MKVYNDLAQGSAEWFEMRRGLLTASLASNLLTPTGRPSSSADTIRHRLLAEKLGLQEPEVGYRTEWMSRGIDMEAEARNWIAFAKGWDIIEVGFIMDDSGWAGCSPDGIVNDLPGYGPLEIKCPKPSTHMGWLEAGTLPPEHRAQVHFQMLMMDEPCRAVFCSYCPPLKPLLVLVEMDSYTDALEQALQTHIEKIQSLYDQLKGDVE